MTPNERFNLFVFDSKLLDYDYVSCRRFISQLNYYGLEKYIEQLFWDMDCERLTKNGFQVISTTHYEYDFIVNNILRCLNRVSDPIVYNNYFERLVNTHRNNIDFDERFNAAREEQERIEADKRRTKKTKRKIDKEQDEAKRVKNEYIRSESTDLFEGTPKYIYSNLVTGDEIISDNPDLLDELNKPKRRKKKDATVSARVVSLPAGFSFNPNRIKKKSQ